MPSPYDIPPLSSQLLHPLKLLARTISLIISSLHPHRQIKRNITLICLSDTHCLIPPDPIPYGDILIHAGDLTNSGNTEEIQAQIDWLASLPHPHKIIIAGNHDTWFDVEARKRTLPASKGRLDWKGITYLQDSSITLDFPTRGTSSTNPTSTTLKIYGSPRTPDILGPEHAFQYHRSEDVWKDQVPDDVDVLVTHGPPRYHLDLPGVKAMGDKYLLQEVRRTRPIVHVFGHIHAGKSDSFGAVKGGQELVRWDVAERYFEKVMAGEGNFVERLVWLLTFVSFSFVALLREYLFEEEVATTRMVNAALMYCNTGRLGNAPQVVHI